MRNKILTAYHAGFDGEPFAGNEHSLLYRAWTNGRRDAEFINALPTMRDKAERLLKSFQWETAADRLTSEDQVKLLEAIIEQMRQRQPGLPDVIRRAAAGAPDLVRRDQWDPQ